MMGDTSIESKLNSVFWYKLTNDDAIEMENFLSRQWKHSFSRLIENIKIVKSLNCKRWIDRLLQFLLSKIFLSMQILYTAFDLIRHEKFAI